MPVPNRVEACRLLLEVGPSPRLLRHVTAVAEIAAFLAARADARGVAVDRRLVESAALLHDVDKALPAGHPLRALGHGDAGARWLVEHDHPELAPAVANHPVSRLGDDDRYPAFRALVTLEVMIVAYADKRAAQRLQPMDRRFARWERRHPDLAEAMIRARQRAGELEAHVCEAAGVDPSGVRRLRWVAEAMDRARAAGSRTDQ